MEHANGGTTSNRESSFHNWLVVVTDHDLSLKVVTRRHCSHSSGWPSRISNTCLLEIGKSSVAKLVLAEHRRGEELAPQAGDFGRVKLLGI